MRQPASNPDTLTEYAEEECSASHASYYKARTADTRGASTWQACMGECRTSSAVHCSGLRCAVPGYSVQIG